MAHQFTRDDIMHHSVDLVEIARRLPDTGLSIGYIKNRVKLWEWWPKPCSQERNGGRIWLWGDVVEALEAKGHPAAQLARDWRPDWQSEP